ncbi:sulfatase family protein [Natronoglomus mannanivorans]|uniref:Sulfatase-like hydrolase/transferase n=1 Tax=Natronoglomus mannanivorans TaxID=2979990 RepID=A0AAP3E2A5_9EURY|nr:sulfatase-like hydrolase/transferase [Halobacteria archaeon AArc-xg1-1]
MSSDRPNVLVVMTDQQRFDTIGALGNSQIHTPNLDRIADSGVSFTNAYTPAPICVPARHSIRTGCEPIRTGYLGNDKRDGAHLEDRCGPFLARAMGNRGYRTFGVGKFHTTPYDLELGYDVHLRREVYEEDTGNELSTALGRKDAVHLLPQTNQLPADETFASWVADRTVDQLREDDDRPFFGMASFMWPHLPFAPPEPYDRMYNPDLLANPVREDRDLDHMDEMIPKNNRSFWNEREDAISDPTARTIRAHYYGMITHVDRQIGRVLDALEAAGELENTVLCFVSDHGELLGDHHGWQKTAAFEASVRVPFLLSWPGRLPAGETNDELVSLLDLFGVATTAAGDPDYRDGIDLVGMVAGDAEPRQRLFAYHEQPSMPPNFTMMVREGDWKYVYMANGGREQLFDVATDPDETTQLREDRPEVAARLRNAAVEHLQEREFREALENDSLAASPFRRLDGVRGGDYPDHPGDLLPESSDEE